MCHRKLVTRAHHVFNANAQCLTASNHRSKQNVPEKMKHTLLISILLFGRSVALLIAQNIEGISKNKALPEIVANLAGKPFPLRF